MAKVVANMATENTENPRLFSKAVKMVRLSFLSWLRLGRKRLESHDPSCDCIHWRYSEARMNVTALPCYFAST
jgi:hypothetical protein